MAEHDEECFILKNLTTLFHCILLVFSFMLSLSCRTKEKQLSFQHSRSKHFKMKFLTAGKKFALKTGFNHFAVSS